jgi:protein-L-isoaspartate O-methyltransferase
MATRDQQLTSVAAEILSLRRDQSSSMTALLAALDWQRAARVEHVAAVRGYAAAQAADIVLLNVAVHAIEAQGKPLIHATRRAVLPSRRKHRRSETGQLPHPQRRLFAL